MINSMKLADLAQKYWGIAQRVTTSKILSEVFRDLQKVCENMFLFTKVKKGTESFSGPVSDHDEGHKSVTSGRHLHWIFLNFIQWIFSFFSRFTV